MNWNNISLRQAFEYLRNSSLAKKHPEIVTIGIGDGGNEIGMGKVLERVAVNVKHGSEIGCTVSCDYLITAGVSNWGGYALAKAIYLCASCPVHDRYRRKSLGGPSEPLLDDFVTTVEQVNKTFISSFIYMYISIASRGN